MLTKLVSNSRPQVIYLPQPPKVPGLQVLATAPDLFQLVLNRYEVLLTVVTLLCYQILDLTHSVYFLYLLSIPTARHIFPPSCEIFKLFKQLQRAHSFLQD